MLFFTVHGSFDPPSMIGCDSALRWMRFGQEGALIARVRFKLMPSSEAKKQFNFSSGARYRICVKGFLDDSWSERFSDMRISNQAEGIISPLAALDGSVRDQTELIGVLNNLYEMHLPLVSVTILDD